MHTQHTHTHMHTHTHTHMHTHICTHTYMHTHIRESARTLKYTTCLCVRAPTHPPSPPPHDMVGPVPYGGVQPQLLLGYQLGVQHLADTGGGVGVSGVQLGSEEPRAWRQPQWPAELGTIAALTPPWWSLHPTTRIVHELFRPRLWSPFTSSSFPAMPPAARLHLPHTPALPPIRPHPSLHPSISLSLHLPPCISAPPSPLHPPVYCVAPV
jgi:hypothetical protein